MGDNIVRVKRPTLTPEEHDRRMKEIKKAAERLVLATIKEKKRRKAK